MQIFNPKPTITDIGIDCLRNILFTLELKAKYFCVCKQWNTIIKEKIKERLWREINPAKAFIMMLNSRMFIEYKVRNGMKISFFPRFNIEKVGSDNNWLNVVLQTDNDQWGALDVYDIRIPEIAEMLEDVDRRMVGMRVTGFHGQYIDQLRNMEGSELSRNIIFKTFKVTDSQANWHEGMPRYTDIKKKLESQPDDIPLETVLKVREHVLLYNKLRMYVTLTIK